MVWGLPGFVMSWYETALVVTGPITGLGIARICNVMVLREKRFIKDHISLGIARICNVMVLDIQHTFVSLGRVWGLPGFVMSWYSFPKTTIPVLVSGDCPDL